nr:F-box/LRR-repeat protein 16-like [Parasteatoda tepidariorum]
MALSSGHCENFPDSIPSAIRPVPHEPDVPVPSTELPIISSESSDSEHPEAQDSDIEYKPCPAGFPQPSSQVELNDLTRDLGLSKEAVGLNREKEFIKYFDEEENLIYCSDAPGLMSKFNVIYNKDEWRLFIDSSKRSLKAVIPHHVSQYASVPVEHSVCTAWREVLYQPKFWRGLQPVLNYRELKTSSATVRLGIYKSIDRRAFDSVCLFGANDEDIYELITQCPPSLANRVRHVALRCSGITDKGLEILVGGLPSIVQLELSGCNEVTDAGLWASLTPRIVSLTLADCINVADDTVAAITQLLPSLYELNLQAYHVTDAALSYFSPRQTTSLCILRLRSCWELTNHGLLNLVHSLPNLVQLSLSGCSKISDDGVEMLAENLRQLRSLDLSWCPRVSDGALEFIACDLSQLEELTLDRCVHITDVGIGYLSTMNNLCTLYLRWCTQIRDYGIKHLCCMRNLQILSLAGCSLVTANGLSTLTQLRHLQELELTNCRGASKELVQYLHQNLPRCLIIE